MTRIKREISRMLNNLNPRYNTHIFNDGQRVSKNKSYCVRCWIKTLLA